MIANASARVVASPACRKPSRNKDPTSLSGRAATQGFDRQRFLIHQ